MISDYIPEERGIISRSLKKSVFLLFICLLATAGLSSLAFAQMSEITPDSVVYTGGADTLKVGQAYNVTVQIQYAGGALKSEGVRVYFLANNTSIIPAELGTYVLTDKNGIATYTVTALGPGNVKLTAMAMSSNSGLSADKTFHVTSGEVVASTATAAPTLTPTPGPSPSPTPTPAASATATIAPTAHPTSSVKPTAAPTSAPTAAPTAAPAAARDANTQALGIITVGIVVAVIVIVVAPLMRAAKK